MTKKVLVLSASFRKHGNSDMPVYSGRAGSRQRSGKNLCQRYAHRLLPGLRRLQPDAQMRAKRRHGRRIGQDGCG